MRNVKALVWLVALVFGIQLVACAEVVPVSSDDANEGLRQLVERSISPSVIVGQTWQVTTAYRAELRDIETDISVTEVDSATVYEAYLSTSLTPQLVEEMVLDEIWAESITWQYRVVEADLLLHKGARFYDLSLDSANNPQSVTVLEVTILGEHGASSAVKELAPMFHLVLRSGDYRLLALEVSYVFDDARRTELIDIMNPDHSNFAAQLESTHALLDFVIPEFPLDDEENRQLTTVQLDSSAVEVEFTSHVDGSLVVQRWDAGQPWFTYSRSDDRFSWLVR